MPALTDHAARILDDLRAREDEMVEFILRLVAVESPSLVPGAQAAVQELLYYALEERGLKVRHLAGEQTGGHLLAERPDRQRHAPIQLLLGHCDTVFPLGTIDFMPAERRGEHIVGPGVADMKTGLAQIVFALDALRRAGLEPAVEPVVFISSDEEIGSGESLPHIRPLAKLADRVFVVEPAVGDEGHLKTGRKGTAHYTVRVTGRAAHAGLDPEKGVSAILELAHVVQELFRLNDPAHGITVNVGTIGGGSARNVIAAESTAVVEARVLHIEDAERIDAAVRALTPTVPGAVIHIEGGFARPPMIKTPRPLWAAAERAANELGIEIVEATVGGASDGNDTSQLAPTLDGMGAVGGGAHSPDEFAVVARIPERTALLARLMLEPALGDSHLR